MRTITTKYAGECRKCLAPLAIGAQVVYERRVGIFCPACAPTDSEEIRKYRQEGADRKADRLEGWAAKREARANAQLTSMPQVRHDWAFITQPGRIPMRERMNRADDRAIESLGKAREFRARAEGLRHVRVAGDAAAARQKARENRDMLIAKGSRVHDPCFGPGTVVGVFKKSYRIAFDRLDRPIARDKSYVDPILQTFAERVADAGKAALAPEFVAWVRAVAVLNGKTEDVIWNLWQVHARENEAMDQSPTQSEFLAWRGLKGPDTDAAFLVQHSASAAEALAAVCPDGEACTDPRCQGTRADISATVSRPAD